MHRHRADPSKRIERPFSGPVARPATREAHGGICLVDRCKCGATRETNSNGGHVERGPWLVDDVITLIPTDCSGIWGLRDPDGGVWWPYEDAVTAAAAMAAYADSPQNGRWVD